MEKKILIIGGCGFIGSHVADFLINKGNKVIVFDRNKPKHKNTKIKYFLGDILTSKILEKLIKYSEIVYNFAAIADIDYARLEPKKTVEINILGTVKILNFCKKYKINRFIQASTIYASSQEGGFYAVSKRSAEEYIIEFSKIFNLKFTILRFGSLYGERADKNNGIKKLIYDAKKNNKLTYRGSKNASRRYIYVKDAAILCGEIIQKKYANKCLTITGKKSIKIKNLLNFFARYFKIQKIKIKFKNEKNTGHYDVKPTSFKIIKATKLFLKKEKNLETNLKNLIKTEKI